MTYCCYEPKKTQTKKKRNMAASGLSLIYSLMFLSLLETQARAVSTQERLFRLFQNEIEAPMAVADTAARHVHPRGKRCDYFTWAHARLQTTQLLTHHTNTNIPPAPPLWLRHHVISLSLPAFSVSLSRSAYVYIYIKRPPNTQDTHICIRHLPLYPSLFSSHHTPPPIHTP
jgi:hypothetical protein